MKSLLLFVLGAVSAWAAPTLDLPRLGCVRDARQQLHLVYGVRGNFVLSAPIAVEVLSFYCSDGVVAAKTAHALIAFDKAGGEVARVEAAGAAIFYFEGKTLSVRLTESDQTYEFQGDGWIEVNAASNLKDITPQLGDCPVTLEQGKVKVCGEAVAGLPSADSVEQIGPEWVHIRSAEGAFAVTLRDRKPEIYALPSASAPAGEQP